MLISMVKSHADKVYSKAMLISVVTAVRAAPARDLLPRVLPAVVDPRARRRRRRRVARRPAARAARQAWVPRRHGGRVGRAPALGGGRRGRRRARGAQRGEGVEDAAARGRVARVEPRRVQRAPGGGSRAMLLSVVKSYAIKHGQKL